ncbi:hypothetical protein LOTGIDRAFT_232880 [Lottia gigantea]|uniref:SEA domain-containing protein n=1 Tax=Lottia gigantea TaxID=225164 RepID=V4AH68_LOTGI|nr:hypothetical protein LOTGIDRAFT_232880 [Lottia gigantea]ESO92736.1 hypothetical protein LOTGIDRAFT_232880 [Lottia gigantea]
MPRSNQWLRNAQSSNDHNIWHTKPQYINGHAPADNSFTLTRENENGRLSKRGLHSDTASLITRSSWTSRRTEKKSANRCCLILMFIIGAIIIAAAIACLVYFLLASKYKNNAHYGRKEADVSVRLLNKTYTPDMANNRSAAFRSVAVPFCDAMDDYFQRNFSKNYNGCRVVELRDIAAREDCACMMKGKHGLVEVFFELDFDGDVRNVSKKKILDVIWGNTKRIPYENVVYRQIDDYLIDIHVAWEASNNGITADVMIPVYNLTYTEDLNYPNSSRYKYHADLFCNDIDSFFRGSKFRNRYVGCTIAKYNMFPLGLDVELLFRGNETHSLQTDLIKIIMDSAKSIPMSNLKLKLIGDLLVTPWDMDFELNPGRPLTTTPLPTTRATTTPTVPTVPGIEVDKVFKLYNFTYNPGLQFPLSPQFKGISMPFCKDFERLHLLGNQGEHYFSCKVYGFGEDPNSIIFSITYKGINPDNQTIIDVIEKSAPRFIEKGKLIYQVGNVFVVANETYYIPTTPTTPKPQTTPTTPSRRTPPIPTPTPASSSVASQELSSNIYLQSSTIFISDNSSCGFSGIACSMIVSSTLHPVQTFTSSIEIPTNITPSMEIGIATPVDSGISSNMENLIDSIEISNIYLTSIEISSMFDAVGSTFLYSMDNDIETSSNMLTSMESDKEASSSIKLPDMESSIENSNIVLTSMASRIETGSMKLTSMESSIESSSVRSDYMYSSIEITTPPTTTPITTPKFTGVTLVELFYRLFDFPYHPDYRNRNSLRFQVLKDETCRQITNYMKMNKALDYILENCDICIHDKEKVTFRLVYSTTRPERLANVSMTTLEKYAPSAEVWPYKLIRVGSLYPIVGSGSSKEEVVTVIGPICSDFPTPPPTPTSTLPPKYDTTVARAVYRLYNFTYRPELNNRSSDYFRMLEKNFCDDIDRFYKASYLFLTYQHCQINRYGTNPEDVEFDLYFYAEISDSLKNDIDSVLKTNAPRKIFYPPGFQQVDTLDVGDLWLVLNNRSLDLIPRNWTKPEDTSSTTIAPTTPIDPLATIPIIKFIRKAKVTMGYRLYQFPFRQELLDRNSVQFKFYRDALCQDLAKLYSNTPTFKLLYETCDLEVFSTSPDSIRFNLVFKTENSELLEGTVKDTLENSRPHFDMPGHKVILVGGMFFILKDSYASKSEFIVPSTVYTTAVPDITPTPPVVATSSIEIPLIYDATNVYLTYEVYNMTDWLDLYNRNSTLFKIYRDRACQDLNDIFRDKTGILYLTYKECDIARFDPNPLKTTFRLTFSQMMSDQLKDTTRRTFEFKAPKKTENGYLLIKAGDMWLILNRHEISQLPTNYTAPPTPTFMPTSTQVVTSTISSTSLTDSFPTISPSPTYTEMSSTQTPTPPPTTTERPLLYDAVLANITYLLYNFTHTPQHNNPNSYEFRKEEQLFCKDVDKVFRNVFQSPFVFTYKECRVEAFGKNPSTVRFHLILSEEMKDELRTLIPNTLQKIAPKLNISDYEVMDLGDLYLVIGQYIISVTHHNYTKRITDPLFITTPSTTTTIRTTQKPIVPTTSSPLVFPTEWVKMQFNANLYNFTWSPELMNPDSRLFRELELKFCNDISRFFSGSMMYTAYRGCKIDSFTSNPSEINFKIGFVSPLYPGLGTDIVTIIEQNAPRIMAQDDSTLTAVMDIGGLFLVWKNFTFYIVSPGGFTSYWIPESTVTLPTTTTEPTYLLKLSFQVLNRTFTRGLADKNSPEFKYQEQLFCDQISEMLTTHRFRFPDYLKCEVDAFVDDPLRVNFSLAFIGQQPEEMKARVIGIIVEGARRVSFNDLYALLIGDLLLNLQGFTNNIHDKTKPDMGLTDPSFDYDGLLYNYTFYLYEGNWTQELSNPNSAAFQNAASRFCNDIDAIFRRHYLNERYYACDIEKVGDFNTKDVIVNIVLNGTVDVGDILVYDVMASNAPMEVLDGIRWLRIGDMLLYANSTGSVRYIRFLNPQTRPPVVTPAPEVSTFLHISFDLLNLTYSAALSDQSSGLFKFYARPFCAYLDRVLTENNRFPSYDRCTVEQFANNPVSVKFNLKFRGAQRKNLQSQITGLLVERAPRALINNQIGLVMGGLGIYDRSIAVAQRTVTGNPVTVPGETPFPFPTRPSPSNPLVTPPTMTETPCIGSTSIFVPHPKDCDKFYLCSNGQGVEIECAAGTRFDPNMSVCVTKPPGFVCPL